MVATVTTRASSITNSSAASFFTGIQTALADAGFPSPFQAVLNSGTYYIVYALSNNSGANATIYWVLTFPNTSSATLTLNVFQTWNTGTFSGTGGNTALTSGTALNVITSGSFSTVAYRENDTGMYGFVVVTSGSSVMRFILGFAKTVSNFPPQAESIAPSVHGIMFSTTNTGLCSIGPTVSAGATNGFSFLGNLCVSATDVNGRVQLVRPVVLRVGAGSSVTAGFSVGPLHSDLVGCPTSYLFADTMTVSGSEIYTYLQTGIGVRTT